MSAEGDNAPHHVKGGVAKVYQNGLFLRDPNEELGRQKVRDMIGEHSLDEIDVANCVHRR